MGIIPMRMQVWSGECTPTTSQDLGMSLMKRLPMTHEVQNIEYTGSCHCGAVKFDFHSKPIKETMRCDCSICSRKGIALSNFVVAPSALSITGTEYLQSYRFGTMIAQHLFCKSCGIHPFVETRFNPGYFRINLGCVDGIEVCRLPVIYFDGRAI